MTLFKEYRGDNLPSTYLVLAEDSELELVVPFNLLHMMGRVSMIRELASASNLPFAAKGRMRITDCVYKEGYCFYKWPGRILGSNLGDVLEFELK